MNAQEMFLLRYRPDHPGMSSNHTGMSRRMLADLSEEQVRRPPCPGVNTLAWLVWHMARVEDIGINRFVTDGEQVFDGGDWGARLGVTRRDLGTGMTPDEVLDLSARIDVPALHDYWDAVEERTLAVVQALRPEDLDTILDAHARAADLRPRRARHARRTVGVRLHGEPARGFFLIHLGLTHIFVHWGEAQAIRGLLGHPGR